MTSGDEAFTDSRVRLRQGYSKSSFPSAGSMLSWNCLKPLVWPWTAIKADRLKPTEGMRLLQDYERGLKDQTYLSLE